MVVKDAALARFAPFRLSVPSSEQWLDILSFAPFSGLNSPSLRLPCECRLSGSIGGNNIGRCGMSEDCRRASLTTSIVTRRSLLVWPQLASRSLRYCTLSGAPPCHLCNERTWLCSATFGRGPPAGFLRDRKPSTGVPPRNSDGPPPAMSDRTRRPGVSSGISTSWLPEVSQPCSQSENTPGLTFRPAMTTLSRRPAPAGPPRGAADLRAVSFTSPDASSVGGVAATRAMLSADPARAARSCFSFCCQSAVSRLVARSVSGLAWDIGAALASARAVHSCRYILGPTLSTALIRSTPSREAVAAGLFLLQD